MVLRLAVLRTTYVRTGVTIEYHTDRIARRDGAAVESGGLGCRV